MSLLISPNGFPLFCDRPTFESVVRDVELVLEKDDSTVATSFDKQLDVLTSLVSAFSTTGGFFKPLIKYPNLKVSPTVVSFLCNIARDVIDNKKDGDLKRPGRDIVIWSSLFSLADNVDDHRPVTPEALELIRHASVYSPHQLVIRLSKVRNISEIMDMMKILFGDHSRR